MVASINASTSAGVVTTADTSGVLALQTAGTTALTLDASQNATFAGSVKTNTLTSAASTALTLQSAGTTAVTIDTNQRAAFVAGTAALPAITTTGDTNTGIWFPAADTIAFSEGGSESMRIDSSGKVGIGLSSPSVPLNVQAQATGGLAMRVNGRSADNYGELSFWNNANSTNYATVGADQAAMYFGTNASLPISIQTAGTERMRIDSSGNLLVATTNSNSNSFKFKVQAATDVCVGLASATAISGALTFNFINDANSANVPVDFRCNGFYISNGLATGAGTNAVKFNTSTKQLTYDTSSARYKNNIRDSIYGLDHVMQMRSAQFEYKDTGNSDVGLIAEEMQPIIPELVGLNEEGLADSVSYDRMVSVLVKALQETKALIDTQAETINALTARIVALEQA